MRQDFDDVAEVSTSKAFEALYSPPARKSFAVLTPKEWKNRYIAYMLKEGCTQEDALSYFEDVEFGTLHSAYDLSDSPEESAEYDLEYN